jgi:hypothetical protein
MKVKPLPRVADYIESWRRHWKALGLNREQEKDRIIATIRYQDLATSIGGEGLADHENVIFASWGVQFSEVYRVRIEPNDGTVEVARLGIAPRDSIEGDYPSVEALPKWMQGKLAVLNMIKIDPPQTMIKPIGMRVEQHVFWILPEDYDEYDT